MHHHSPPVGAVFNRAQLNLRAYLVLLCVYPILHEQRKHCKVIKRGCFISRCIPRRRDLPVSMCFVSGQGCPSYREGSGPTSVVRDRPISNGSGSGDPELQG